jgi:3-oxoacyl-[acyl-carrier-protein] synthase-1
MNISLSSPGLICCAGNNRDELFAAALNGNQSGIRPLVLADGRRFLAGRVPDAALPPENGGETGGRLYRMAQAALEQIRGDIAAAAAAFGPERVGVCAGSCDNGSEASLPAHRAFFAAGSAGAFPPDYDIRFQSASMVAEYIAARCGVTGPCLTLATACASGASAVIAGARLIAGGVCDAVIAGGVDLASETALLGFAALEAVSGGICNPLSKNRDGITLGEGAAFFVMRKTGSGCPRPAIELLGCGESADAHHMTAPRPDGGGAVAAMRRALASAGISPGAVGYVNLHGTGTPLNDRMEAAAMREVFGDAAPPASSTKPVTGHALGAAGALELALCWMTLSAAAGAETAAPLPLHCWDGQADDAIPALNIVTGETRAKPRVCMSNSFAFGGCNVSLIIGRRDHG